MSDATESMPTTISNGDPWWAARERLLRDRYRIDSVLRPEEFYPYYRPCDNRVLIVADLALDFTEAAFGLGVFVRTLLDAPGGYVRHRITLAHVTSTDPGRFMPLEDRISRRILGFKFDDADHFTPDMYDVVMLFGFGSTLPDRGISADGQRYPGSRLADTELKVLTEYMNGGGGIFATGDHGNIGKALGSAVPRIRGMRLWDATDAQEAWDEVAMIGPLRNDTNRGPTFDSQSDDIPQAIQPKMYVAGSMFPVHYPHPLLCGPRGPIVVMPDHPHEGECIEPTDTRATIPGGGAEYPAATDGGGRPLPEIISTSTVPARNGSGAVIAGNVVGGKAPTHPQEFGGICAYDGHRASVGRVVTDATWHHFVNVNLVGTKLPSSPASFDGFLGAGVAHLEEVRAYYRNLAIWLSRPERIRCMNTRLALLGVFDGKVLEAVLTSTDSTVGQLSPLALLNIGVHARDVLGRMASDCQVVGLVLDLVLRPAIPDLIPDIDPWFTDPRETELEPTSAWAQGTPLIDIAFGAALVALRTAIGEPDEHRSDVDADRVAAIMAEGGAIGVELARRSAADDLERLARFLRTEA